MGRLTIPEEPTYRENKNSLKRWTIYDRITGQISDITDESFAQGLKIRIIELRGRFIEVENKHKIWIDGIVKK